MPNPKTDALCPYCGEPIEAVWKFCPVCETPLGALTCPQCQTAVKENWKRCPACGAHLFCPSCHLRIRPGLSVCPVCDNKVAGTKGDRTLNDPVTGMTFVKVPGGRFDMGDNFGDGMENETPVHRVQLDSFSIAIFPVTQAQWMRLMTQNPSHSNGDNLPVEQVSWHDVQTFIQKLIQANGGKPSFRLPTEAEWEYAARSGGILERYAGADTPDGVAWYEENSAGTTQTVGSKAPNGLGLYDMSGNVWEWCQDVFSESAYQRHPKKNPLCMSGGNDRVIRGGSWNVDAWSVRCSRRFSLPPDYFGAGLGFRLVIVN